MIDLKKTLLPNLGFFKVFKWSSLKYFFLIKSVEGDVLGEVIEVAHVNVGQVKMVRLHDYADMTVGVPCSRLY